MKSDLTRETFDRALHYSAVRLQQGRIVTDADWNEQGDLTRYRAERQARDIIGPCGAPMDAAGYGLVAETNALAVHAVNASVAWILGEDGVLLTTVDTGGHWTLVDLQTTARLYALQQVGAVGWLVGEGGTVRKTTDTGATWTSQDAGTLSTLRGVAVFDANHAWAVGDGGIVVLTGDGGATWTSVQTDAARLYAVRFRDGSNGLAVGQAGAIVATSDGGQTWTSATSGTSAQLRALALFGTTRAWAAGQNGTILRSTDSGATWQACNNPSTATLNAIGFLSASEGWAAGADGVLLRSTDGGANWTVQNAGIAATLRGLSFFGGQPGWLVGDGSTVRRLSSSITIVALPAVNLSIEPGHCYVNGTLCELEERASYAHQPNGGATERLTAGAYLMYLDVWQRHLSALEAPPIREVALGGPDTATRAQIICQVKALPLPTSSPSDWNCDSVVPDWNAMVNAARPRLAARAEPQLASTNLCEIAATAGYRRLENQLYRVEVHEGGTSPTFKWSRENGSVAYAVVGVTIDAVLQQTIVRVAARGRDANLDVASHDRVELIDDDAELAYRAGTLFEYLNDGDDELELVLDGIPGGAIGQDPARHPVLRRWDHKPAGSPSSHALPITGGVWIDLEDGVQIRFEPGGSYRPGDYWQIPARTITADVEWPRDDNGDSLAREPAGIADAYCRLGIVEVDATGGVMVVSDCRDLFPPLTMLTQLLYVSGDGQDAAPGAQLPQPLTVRVARGSVPVIGVTVRFEIESGGGKVSGGSALFETTTVGPDGLATCAWTLDPATRDVARFQRVRASLLDANHQPVAGQVVVFCATASLVLDYVSGDGQEAPPAGALPHPLEVRVANGVDGIPAMPLRVIVEQGGGNVSATNLTTDPQGQAAVNWQIGTGGPQRVRIELLDDQGQVLQRLSFNATVAQQGAGGARGCDITIGKGGDFEKLDNELLAKLLEAGEGHACICFLPGVHDLDGLQGEGNRKFRLSLHGCGHASVLRIRGNIVLSGFIALELRDLVIQAAGELGVVLQRNLDLRLSNLQIDRPRTRTANAVLRIAGADRVGMIGCTVTTVMPSPAAVFDGITRNCDISGNRFTGMVSFYGDPSGLPTQDILAKVASMMGQLRIEAGTAHLTFTSNTLSLLTVSKEMASSLLQGTANGVFATAAIDDNTFEEQMNLFVAGLLGFSTNNFVAKSANDGTPFGVMAGSRATAVGNLAGLVSDNATLFFATADPQGFSKAANQVFVSP